MQAKSFKSKKNELGLDQNEIIGIVMKLVVPKIEGLVKEAFNSFADDYLRELNAVKYELSRIYTGDFFACDFWIKMDLAKLHLLNGGFDHDNWDLTDGNNCLQLVSYQYCYN